LSIDKQSLKESVGDTALALLINFPLNMLLLYVANRTFIPKLDSEGDIIFWTSVFLTFWFTLVAITRKYFVRVWFKNKELNKIKLRRESAVH
jgi:ascorbate-specific PTS system EIIC-type component UlaA